MCTQVEITGAIPFMLASRGDGLSARLATHLAIGKLSSRLDEQSRDLSSSTSRGSNADTTLRQR